MMHYQLRCAARHEFDGWFKDSGAFDRQARRGLIECPQCGDSRVERAMMAPGLTGRAAAPQVPPEPAKTAAVAEPSNPPMPAQLRGMLQRLRAEVEKSCDYVGPAFADEVRKIHRGDVEKRSIYGETTPEQAESLADEGIEVAAIPWVPRADG